MSGFDQTPSHSTKAQARVDVRSLREVISSCDKLTLSEHVSVSASIESIPSVVGKEPDNTSWVGSIHEKPKTPAKYYSPYHSGTPIHRQLNFSTPVAARKPDNPSPTVSSAISDRWCLESVTPTMRYTPPNMSIRGMRMVPQNNTNREPIGAYKITESIRRDNERGASLCILPTPLLRFQTAPSHQYSDYTIPRDPLTEISPKMMPSRPSPTISIWGSSPANVPSQTPTPVGPMQKKHRAGFNSRHFPIPRPTSVHKNAIGRRPSAPDIELPAGLFK
jgi:hypothetical protein